MEHVQCPEPIHVGTRETSSVYPGNTGTRPAAWREGPLNMEIYAISNIIIFENVPVCTLQLVYLVQVQTNVCSIQSVASQYYFNSIYMVPFIQSSKVCS